MKMRISLLALSAALVLSACDQPVKENALFPLAAGKSWTYQVETVYDEPDGKTLRYTLEMRNLGSAALADGSTAWIRRSSNGHEYWLTTDDKVISRVAMKIPTKGQADMDPEPRTVLPQAPTLGSSWTSTTVPYFLRRRNEQPSEFRYLDKFKNMPMVFTVADMDVKISTPAGQFEHCMWVDGKMAMMLWNDQANAYKPTDLTTREWYCPDVGLVQVERDEPTTAKFFQGGSMRMKLLHYE